MAEDMYQWSSATYNVGSADNTAGRLTQWSRGTVADGKWLNKVTIVPFSGRDEYLLESINDLHGKKQAKLTSNNVGYGIAIDEETETSDMKFYLNPTATENIGYISGANNEIGFKLSADINVDSITANDILVTNLTVQNLSAYDTSAVNISGVLNIVAATAAAVDKNIEGFSNVKSTNISARNIYGLNLTTQTDNLIDTYNTVDSNSAYWGKVSAVKYYNNGLNEYAPTNGVITLSSDNLDITATNGNLNLRTKLYTQKYQEADGTKFNVDSIIFDNTNDADVGVAGTYIYYTTGNGVYQKAGSLVPDYARGNIITSADPETMTDKKLVLQNNQWVEIAGELTNAYYSIANKMNSFNDTVKSNLDYGGAVALGDVTVNSDNLTGCFAWGTNGKTADVSAYSIGFKGTAHNQSIAMKGSNAKDYSCSLAFGNSDTTAFAANCANAKTNSIAIANAGATANSMAVINSMAENNSVALDQSQAHGTSFGSICSNANGNSIAIQNAYANGTSIAMTYANADNGSVAFKSATADFGSIAIESASATNGSIAMEGASATGGSIALLSNAYANSSSIAIGNSTSAMNGSMALLGRYANNSSYAFGSGATASNTSIAIGIAASANQYAAALGYGVHISNSACAVGVYNNPTAKTTGKSLVFAVGNGTADTKRSNAFEVYSDGSIYAPGLTADSDKVLWSKAESSTYRPLAFADAGKKSDYDAGNEFYSEIVYDSDTTNGLKYNPMTHQLSVSAISAKNYAGIPTFKDVSSLPEKPEDGVLYIV